MNICLWQRGRTKIVLLRGASKIFRLAAKEDLPELKDMYTKIINNMNSVGIEIWDDIYPCEFFADDIAHGTLYLLSKESLILGAFVLCESNVGESHIKWEKENAKAMYLDRLGVNIDFERQGIATQLLNYADEIAKEKMAEYLRLFVIDINTPAINLYKKNGFLKADGVYVEVIDETLSFSEYGFEKKL